jgi:hypothetical protein
VNLYCDFVYLCIECCGAEKSCLTNFEMVLPMESHTGGNTIMQCAILQVSKEINRSRCCISVPFYCCRAVSEVIKELNNGIQLSKYSLQLSLY